MTGLAGHWYRLCFVSAVLVPRAAGRITASGLAGRRRWYVPASRSFLTRRRLSRPASR
jgi:hypothetical protein